MTDKKLNACTQIDDHMAELLIERLQLMTKECTADPSRAQRWLDDILQKDETLSPQLHLFAQTLRDIYQVMQETQTPPSPWDERLTQALTETPHCLPRGGDVAVQGTVGAYSELAARHTFPYGRLHYFPQFGDVAQAVAEGRCTYGLLPIENSNGGSVHAVYDLFTRYPLHISLAHRQLIRHGLLGKPDATLSDIREVLSHPQALAQCSQFLSAHPEITVTEVSNTARAAETVRNADRRDLAAIASIHCADLYELSLLDDAVQDSAHSYTRFVCVHRNLEIYPGANKISMVLSTDHQPGSLYRVISQLAALGLNMTKLESRPIPGRNFEFLFYFDFEGSVHTPAVRQFLNHLAATNKDFMLLGHYPEFG